MKTAAQILTHDQSLRMVAESVCRKVEREHYDERFSVDDLDFVRDLMRQAVFEAMAESASLATAIAERDAYKDAYAKLLQISPPAAFVMPDSINPPNP